MSPPTAPIRVEDRPPGMRAGAAQRGRADRALSSSLFGILLIVTTLLAFSAVGGLTSPASLPLLLCAATLGSLVVVDARTIGAIPLPPSVLAFAMWMLCSYAWSETPDAAMLAMRRDLPLVVVAVVVAGVVPLDTMAAAFLWSVRIAVGLSVVAAIALPSTRSFVEPLGDAPPLPGWRGLFPHKNVMAPFLAFGLATVLAFDRRRLTRWGTVAAICVLLIGSQSITGMSGAIVAGVVWVWIRLASSADRRTRATLVVVSACGAVLVALAAAFALGSITQLTGRDPTFSGRTRIWSVTIDAWAERPLLGFGPNGVLFGQPVTARTLAMWRAIGFDAPHPHNGFLDVGVQLGVIGLAIFLGIVASTFVGGVRLARTDPRLGAWVVTIVSAQVVMAVAEDVFLGSGWLVLLVMLRQVVRRGRRAAGHALDPAAASGSSRWR